MQILDNPAWAALTGPQAAFADRYGRSARFPADVSMFAALDDPADPEAWHDLGRLAGPGGEVLVAAPTQTPPPGWTWTGGVPGVQLVAASVAAAPDPEAVVLTGADVPEILDLVERTQPGPFRKRTIDLGTYLGIRRDGALIAMAGERMRLPGYTEISAVCTDPAFRGAGLASRLIRAVSAGIQQSGAVPFLHTAAQNTGAIRLYEQLGFALRTDMEFAAYRVP
ncbi:GNAT family N-acetyltransferase [Actinoplanes sp. NPDC049668]|uniref:GNAT family N-acetyltransferase n=1 Tax=unclassified Actinoplanes TaxID=2626549 RepID=UPI0033B730F9